MTHSKITRLAAASVSSLGLVVGFAGLAGASASDTTAHMSYTGPDSSNVVRTVNRTNTTVRNNNNLTLTNNNPQHAYSGSAEVEGNTRGGDAWSGNATNNSTMNATVHVTNSSVGGSGGTGGGSNNTQASMSYTGPDSYNKISTTNTTTTNVTNTNDVRITNNNTQTATSGSAEVEHNTVGGNAVSGDASNTSNTSFNVSISN